MSYQYMHKIRKNNKPRVVWQTNKYGDAISWKYLEPYGYSILVDIYGLIQKSQKPLTTPEIFNVIKKKYICFTRRTYQSAIDTLAGIERIDIENEQGEYEVIIPKPVIMNQAIMNPTLNRKRSPKYFKAVKSVMSELVSKNQQFSRT